VSPRAAELPFLAVVKNGPLAESLGLTIPPGPTSDITLPPVPTHLEEEKEGEVAQTESSCDSSAFLGAFGKYKPSIPGSQLSLGEKNAPPVIQKSFVSWPAANNKRQTKEARKQQIEVARSKRWLKNEDLEYGIVSGTQGLFAKPTGEDLQFDPDHDKFVLESTKKYDYLLLRAFKKTKKLPFSRGIFDKTSAKEHLGEQFDTKCILVKGSVCYSGKICDWQNLHILVAIPMEGGPVCSSLHHLVPLKPSSVIDVLPYDTRIAIISLLAYEAEFIGGGIEFQLPARYLRYNTRPGADFSTVTKEQVE
jgi:hypothetical protein